MTTSNFGHSTWTAVSTDADVQYAQGIVRNNPTRDQGMPGTQGTPSPSANNAPQNAMNVDQDIPIPNIQPAAGVRFYKQTTRIQRCASTPAPPAHCRKEGGRNQ
jgi:hypothetical protein